MGKNQKWYQDQYWNWMPTELSYSEFWMAKSADYLPDAQIIRNLPYGGGHNEVFDVFLPSQTHRAPVLIFIHGGYWQWMDNDTYAFSLEPIRAAGAIVASINYTLCPENSISGIVEKVRRACVHIYNTIETYHGDRDDIHVTGHSAGGHLTAMVAATNWHEVDSDLPIDLIKSAIPSSGIFDMNNIRLTPQLNAGMNMDQETANQNSPIFLDPSYDMPISVVVGADESEGFILESKNFTSDWGKKVTNIRYIEIPGVHHFNLIENLINTNDPFLGVILNHLKLNSS